jgi:hypothetical protein
VNFCVSEALLQSSVPKLVYGADLAENTAEVRVVWEPLSRHRTGNP